MARVYNFSAGPAMLPEEVLHKAANELVDYQGTGMSVMEMSHRSKAYDSIHRNAEVLLRELMNIPDNYYVLFLQGGATTQFSAIPLNLLNGSGIADFVHTGNWSKKAIGEAKRYGTARVVASSEEKTFTYIPPLDKSTFTPNADYFYIVTNNTIYGTRFNTPPDIGTVPLVADMSSNILSQVYDVSKFAVIFAGAQKNIGPAGLTIVIVRKDLVGHARDITPVLLDWKTQADTDSLYNTPPCYSIYIAKLVFEYLKENGGIPAMQARNEEKAAILYDFLDQSDLFKATVAPKDRSLMNIPFVTGNEELDAKFVKQAEAVGLVTLKGHRSVGGMRASIYNAMPKAGVQKLVEFMKKFEMDN
ncbi:3-phosphoserine/phosphohydroxythreonine transaminase [candidate division KSB1 bacterium]|nr:3-phosphoserine/phosphohydroxythreonine transaminase [candidate division KSB1 bacterium]